MLNDLAKAMKALDGKKLLLYCLLGWRTSLQRLKVAAHVLVKSWFAAPLPCPTPSWLSPGRLTHFMALQKQ